VKKKFYEYVDSFGFINHFDSNGNYDSGDSTQRTFSYWLNKFDQNPDDRFINAEIVESLFSVIKLQSGEYVRSPLSGWWNEPGTLSRDQLTPMVCCMVLYAPYNNNLKIRKNELIANLLRRGGFCWNTKHIGQITGWKIPDWMGLSLISLLMRSGWGKLLFAPITWIFDLVFCLNSILLVLRAFIDAEETGIDLNFQNICYTQSQFFAPFNLLAKLIYIALRPQPALPGHARETIGHPSYNVWRCYYYEDSAPPMDIILKPWIEKWFY
jgi:hypothetical protein